MKIRADIDTINFDADVDGCAKVTFIVPDHHKWGHGSYAIEKWENHDTAIDLAAKCLWARDYPNGGSVYKTFDDTPYHDKEIYRQEVIEILGPDISISDTPTEGSE